MNWKTYCGKGPNRLFTDTRLHYSARQVGAALYSYQKNGVITRSLKEIAKLSGVRSTTTVQKAIDELVDAHYIIEKITNYRYSDELKCDINDSNGYMLDMTFVGGFTLIPRHLFRLCYGNYSTFAVITYILQMMGNKTRAFPSLSQIAKKLGGMSVSTVCKAIKRLAALNVFYVEHCKKRNRDRVYLKNSYFLLRQSSCHSNSVPTHDDPCPADNTDCDQIVKLPILPYPCETGNKFIPPSVSIIRRIAREINNVLQLGVLRFLVNKELRLR